MASTRKTYEPIDLHGKAALWPETIPKLTAEEAVRAARRLWRFAMGETFEGEITVSSGNRYTWTYWPPGSNHIALRVNPDPGWKRFIHDLSHLFVERCNPGEGHSKFHARFETKLVKEVIKRGWLEGKLLDKPKPEPKPVDKRAVKVVRIEEAITRWERKRMRAVRALAKLNRQKRYYDRIAA